MEMPELMKNGVHGSWAGSRPVQGQDQARTGPALVEAFPVRPKCGSLEVDGHTGRPEADHIDGLGLRRYRVVAPA